jgi:hypothetical protein
MCCLYSRINNNLWKAVLVPWGDADWPVKSGYHCIYWRFVNWNLFATSSPFSLWKFHFFIKKWNCLWMFTRNDTYQNFKTLYPRCVLGNKNHSRFKHNNSFIQYYLNNMFRPNGPSSSWQNGRLNTQFWMENCVFNLPIFPTLWCTFGPKHVEVILNKYSVAFYLIYCDSCYLRN